MQDDSKTESGQPGSLHPLVRALDQLIDQVKLSYAAETDPEWKRNTGFELQGIRRARTVIAAAVGPNAPAHRPAAKEQA